MGLVSELDSSSAAATKNRRFSAATRSEIGIVSVFSPAAVPSWTGFRCRVRVCHGSVFSADFLPRYARVLFLLKLAVRVCHGTVFRRFFCHGIIVISVSSFCTFLRFFLLIFVRLSHRLSTAIVRYRTHKTSYLLCSQAAQF